MWVLEKIIKEIHSKLSCISFLFFSFLFILCPLQIEYNEEWSFLRCQLGQVYRPLIVGPLNWFQLSFWSELSTFACFFICCLVIATDQISIFMISSCYWLKWLVWFVAYISKTGDKFGILSRPGHIIGWLFCN